MNPTFDGSGKFWSLAFQTCAFRQKTFMCSWKFLLNALMPSESPLISILMLTLRGLDLGVPSSAYFLNLAVYRRALQLSQSRPSASLIGSFDRGGFVRKEIGVTPSTLLWNGIQTGGQDLPRIFFIPPSLFSGLWISFWSTVY